MANELKWEDLRDQLYLIHDTENVYYDPPESISMEYPCFRFELNNLDVKHADNKAYSKKLRWAVTYITRDVEEIEQVSDEMLEHFKYCNFDTSFRADNLEHAVFNLYF